MKTPHIVPVLASLMLAVLATGAQAQNVYRNVGADGKVTFSDRPLAEGGASTARNVAIGPAAALASLPIALRQATSRFPVTLYTGGDCAPCTSARNLLSTRGVPFTERTVITNEDIAALQRLSGNTSLPFGTVGGQQLVGFSDSEWTQYLDAAGYPKQSQLPASYRQAAATPLVEVKAVAAPVSPAASAANAAATTPPAATAAPAPANPAGIRF